MFRDEARDVIARSRRMRTGEALLRPVILGGQLVEPLPTLEEARTRAAQSIAKSGAGAARIGSRRAVAGDL